MTWLWPWYGMAWPGHGMAWPGHGVVAVPIRVGLKNMLREQWSCHVMAWADAGQGGAEEHVEKATGQVMAWRGLVMAWHGHGTA